MTDINDNIMIIKAYSDRIIRMTYAAKEDFEKESLIVTAKPLPVAAPDIRTEIDENRNVAFFRNGKRLSLFSCPVFEAYDIYKSTGGAVEVRETVDGLRSSAKDGGKQFVRTSYHASFAIDIDEEPPLR